jgi:hypothetical protein
VSPIQVLKLPDGVTFDLQPQTSADGIENTDFILKSKYGYVTFRVAPYPQRISARSRQGSVLYKYCEVSDDTGIWLAKFYVQLRADFRGLGIFSNYFREDFLPWVEGLFQCMTYELDWQECLEGDVERMVVSLTRQVEALQRATSVQGSGK